MFNKIWNGFAYGACRVKTISLGQIVEKPCDHPAGRKKYIAREKKKKNIIKKGFTVVGFCHPVGSKISFISTETLQVSPISL